MFKLDKVLARDTVEVGELELCKVLLMNDVQYPWVILVPKISTITEIFELNPKQQRLLMNESNQLLELMAKEFDADKMNVGALGNVVSQLHIHHIVRYQADKAWPAPIWGHSSMVKYSEVALAKMIERLKKLVTKIKSSD